MLCGADGAPYVAAACAGFETKIETTIAKITETTADLPLKIMA
jgi:hypothetical protein